MKKVQKLGLFTTWVLISVVLFNSNVELVSFQDQEGMSDVPLMEWGGKAKVAADLDAFISIWNTTLTSVDSSASNQVSLPLEADGTYNFLVVWGDGSSDAITSWDQGEVTHTYSSPGMYTITITGTIHGWQFHYRGEGLKIIEIQQWGTLRVGNSGGYFTGCENLHLTTTDTLDLTGITSLSRAFSGCSSLGISGNLNAWDVSSVTDMSSMFGGASLFNQTLASWDVSSVTTMGGMFWGASLFNQTLTSWDVSSVTNMWSMFRFASSFNQSLTSWDVSSVTDMGMMFEYASSFNHPLGCWNISSVTNINKMFSWVSSFNQSLESWNVSSVTSMSFMFSHASSFNQPLDAWDVSNVTVMEGMFVHASSFNQPLDAWNVSSVTDMREMFSSSSFNQSLASWDVSSVTSMYGMFSEASSFNQPLDAWNISSVTDMDRMFFGVTLSTSNYDSMLISWSQLPLQNDVAFDAGNSRYSAGDAETARQLIIDTFGWTITDGGNDRIAGFPPAWFGVIMLGSLIGLVASLRTRRR